MSRIVSFTQKAAAGAKRIFDILDHVSSNVPSRPTRAISRCTLIGRIDGPHRDPNNRWGSATATASVHAHGSTWTLRPGEMIGLVGHSGSGKSTLVNLICRFYDVHRRLDPDRWH